jgi:NADPH:quinone reductase-like Zn-dependent oxidoreductase
MRAVVHDRYGPPEVLRLEDVERPVPKDDEVLVRIHATTVNRTDCGVRAANPFITRFFTGLRRPRHKILGMELAGEVDAVGGAVSEFEVGDQVFGVNGHGAHAQFVCMRETAPLAHKPTDMTFEEAAAVCDGANQGLANLSAGNVGEGTRLLVYGASGSCGTAAVQLGKHYFGAHVTAVCNAKNIELVRSLGADEVIDYQQEDFTKNGERYDVVLDAVGKHSFFRSRSALTPDGVFVATDGLHNFPLAFLTSRRKRKVVFTIEGARPGKENILLFKRLLEEGKYRPVVDRTYPLENVVEAHRYVESWQKTGNVVLTLDGWPVR